MGQNLQEIRVRPLDPAEEDRFGSEVVIKDSLLFITAINDNDPVMHSGSAYIFSKEADNWIQFQKIPGTLRPNSHFGISLAVSNDNKILIGAPDDTASAYRKTGVAYLYEFENGGWIFSQRIYPEPDNNIINRGFGYSVDIAENFLAIGAPWDGTVDSITGSVYIFIKDSSNWMQSDIIAISGIYHYAYMGTSVVFGNNTLFVGIPGLNKYGNNSGSVYIYENVNGIWEFIQSLIPEDLQPENFFGGKTSVYDSILAVTAYGSIGSVNYRGAVYIFEKRNDEWIETQRIVPEDDIIERLGSSIKLYKDTLLIGAIDNNNKGLICLYIKENNSWIKKYEFRESIGGSGVNYGGSCDMINSNFAISATGYLFNSGAVYVYREKPVSVNDNNTQIPSNYILYQNYPNPFNPSTTIEFNQPEDGFVTLKVYDILGRDVKTLIEDYRNKGKNSVEFFAGNISGGVYFYEIKVNDFTARRKMILMK